MVFAARYRARRPRQPLAGRVAVVADDGIAIGPPPRAACQTVREHGAARVVLAYPSPRPAGRRKSVPTPSARSMPGSHSSRMRR